MKEQIKEFVKKNKKGLVITGTILGMTGAFVVGMEVSDRIWKTATRSKMIDLCTWASQEGWKYAIKTVQDLGLEEALVSEFKPTFNV